MFDMYASWLKQISSLQLLQKAKIEVIEGCWIGTLGATEETECSWDLAMKATLTLDLTNIDYWHIG